MRCQNSPQSRRLALFGSVSATILIAAGTAGAQSMQGFGGGAGTNSFGSSGSSGSLSSSGGSFSGSALGSTGQGSSAFGSSSSGSSFGTTNTFGSGSGSTGYGSRSTTGGGSSTSVYQGVATSNAFSTYYANPLSLGLPGGTGRATFGTPLYTLTTPGTTGTGITGSLSTGLAGSLGSASSTGTSTFTPASSGRPSAPVYFALDFRPATLGPSQVQTDVRQILARSSSLASKGTIQVGMDGEVVVLRGTVADAHEARLAENLIRLTPGVAGIRNELTIRGTLARGTP
jgi:hypothetical protein